MIIKLEFFLQIFKKHSNIKFLKNPSGGGRVVPCGRTDGQTNITNVLIRLSHFYARA